MTRSKYLLIGTGSRAKMYLDAIAGPHADVAELVGWSDSNDGRLNHYEAYLAELGHAAPHRFAPEDLVATIDSLGADRVIITTPDFTHAGYVVAALDAGADVVVEKPLTVNEAGVQAIADAVDRTGRKVIVTFNYRYSPRNSALKQLIQDGEIGEVTSVHFEWLLDTAHGADYFRRWHRLKEKSGGLLIHKASHHFDLVNWWIDDIPTRVFASGGLRFYGSENAKKRGMGERPPRGSVDHEGQGPFSLDLRENDGLKALYYDQEPFDGYLRDRDVFADGITIEDNLSLVVDYAGGSTMSYSLSAHGPWEGYTVYVNGTKGRAELTVVERGAVLPDEDGRIVIIDASANPDGPSAKARPVSERLVLQKHFETAVDVPIPEGSGGHGGGDEVLLREVFVGLESDPLSRAATWIDGVQAMAVGLAGNRSLENGQSVLVGDLELGAFEKLANE